MWTVWRPGSPAASRQQQQRILWAELPTVFLIPVADVSSRCSCWNCDCLFHCFIGRQAQKAAKGRPAALFLRSSPSKADWLLWLQSMFFFLVLLTLFIRPHVSAPSLRCPRRPPCTSLRERIAFVRLQRKKKKHFLCFHFMWQSRRQSASVLFAAAGSREQRLPGGHASVFVLR